MRVPRFLWEVHFLWLLGFQFLALPAPCASVHIALATHRFLRGVSTTGEAAEPAASSSAQREGAFAFARLFYRLMWLSVSLQKCNGRFYNGRVLEVFYCLPRGLRVPPLLLIGAEAALALCLFRRHVVCECSPHARACIARGRTSTQAAFWRPPSRRLV